MFIIQTLSIICSPSRDRAIRRMKILLKMEVTDVGLAGSDSEDSDEDGEVVKGNSESQPATESKQEVGNDGGNGGQLPKLNLAVVYRRIMKIIENMKLDMANYHLLKFRPMIVANCVKYEKEKFSACMITDYRMGVDSLKETRNWLLEHKTNNDLHPKTSISKAFIHILNPENTVTNWPEVNIQS